MSAETNMAKWLKNARDRISNLPDPIIHQIFSLLPTNYMVALRMVSKRFNQLCLSSPYLKFANTRLHKGAKRRRGFRRFVDKFMSKTNCFNTIYSLHLSLFTLKKKDYAKERSRVHRWIKQAANSNVQELKLELNLPDKDLARVFMDGIGTYVSTIFTCKNLRVLEIYELHGSREKVELPLVVLSSLEHLTLKSVHYGGQIPFGEWISTYCPSLRKLNLAFMSSSLGVEPHKLEITHHALEDIKIINSLQSSTEEYYTSLSCDKLLRLSLKSSYVLVTVQISAPRLKFLEFEGNFILHIRLSNLDSLSTVIFNTSGLEESYLEEAYLGRQVVELQKIWKSAKSLHLTMNIIEFLFLRNQETELLDKLNNLEITIKVSLQDYHSLLLNNLITRMPNLVSLTIRETNDYPCSGWMFKVRSKLERSKDAQKREFLVQNLPVVSTVKEMMIEFHYCDKVRKEHKKFIKYFLKTMSSLQKMTICSSYSSFKREFAFLEKRPKVSSSGLLIFRKVKKQPRDKAKRCFELE